jgi:hypothetical protein
LIAPPSVADEPPEDELPQAVASDRRAVTPIPAMIRLFVTTRAAPLLLVFLMSLN